MAVLFYVSEVLAMQFRRCGQGTAGGSRFQAGRHPEHGPRAGVRSGFRSCAPGNGFQPRTVMRSGGQHIELAFGRWQEVRRQCALAYQPCRDDLTGRDREDRYLKAEFWRPNLGKATVIQIIQAIAVIAFGSPASAQNTLLERECPIGNETVMVQVQEVPDLKQRCYKVIYEKQNGYVCVWAGGTPERPYGFTENFHPEHVTKEGWNAAGGGSVGCKADQCFRSLCSRLVRKHREEEGRSKFDPEAAAESLDKFFRPQMTRQTPEEPQQ